MIYSALAYIFAPQLLFFFQYIYMTNAATTPISMCVLLGFSIGSSFFDVICEQHWNSIVDKIALNSIKISKYRDSAIQCYLPHNAIQCYFNRNAIQCYFIDNAIPMLFIDNAIQCYFDLNAIVLLCCISNQLEHILPIKWSAPLHNLYLNGKLVYNIFIQKLRRIDRLGRLLAYVSIRYKSEQDV